MLSGLYSGVGGGVLWFLGACIAFTISFIHLVAIAMTENHEYHMIRMAVWAVGGLVMVLLINLPSLLH